MYNVHDTGEEGTQAYTGTLEDVNMKKRFNYPKKNTYL